MSIIKVTTRGNTVRWTATFKDFAGEVVSPDSAVVKISHSDDVAVSVTMNSNTAGEWSAEWDSSVALSGTVYWSVQATNPSFALDGQFELSANPANPDPT
ncbi:MAG: hypothetical protein JWL86_5410 [Rhizobium sp.]|nr:hypothetical protein [Rhizobium sp.]